MKKNQKILVHLLFWAVMFIFTGLETIPSFGKESYFNIAGDFFIYAFSFISFFYLFYFFISEKHLDKKKTFFLALFGLLFLIIITVPVVCLYIYFLIPYIFGLNGKEFLQAFGRNYFSFLETNFIFAISGSLLKTALLWYDNIMKQKEIEKQVISCELVMLKSQINPQFLFNTLKSIKSLTENQPEKAIYSIENLSEIMSYMLYETSADKVLLDDEINNINNYLNLQRVRYSLDSICFAITGNTKNVFVPPLIFMPFIENAFKYSDSFSQSPGIIINLDIKNDTLLFVVTNHIKENVNKDEPDDSFNLKAIKRHLDLLFNNNYNLEIKNENNKYIIMLNIILSF
jgi:two-component system, LytTR family, sensor kinase